ncbi:MAG: ATP-binding protein [archaeon]
MKGHVISGEFDKIIVRQKSDQTIELGDLLVAQGKDEKIILQAYDLVYGSQLSQQNLELISGIKLEEDNDLEIFDKNTRSYKIAYLKPLVTIRQGTARLCKTLPGFFSEVNDVTKDDLDFLTKPKNPLLMGKLRSGSRVLDVDIYLPGDKVLAHHILIAGTTGRGKSVLVKNLLWNTIESDYCGMLVLDPHNEYYGTNDAGLKDHSSKKAVYYTSRDPPPGTRTLKINLKVVKPEHFSGVYFSDPQVQAMTAYHRKYGERWIEAVILEQALEVNFHEGTLSVLRRRMMSLLSIDCEKSISPRGIFDLQAGSSTIEDICSDLEKSKVVIIDTSAFSGQVELIIGSIIASEIFSRYRYYKQKGTLKDRPVISIVLEEAPRVLGKDVLEKGSNIFEAIAREGRKFKVGLTAITQLPSLIPRQILANMNTKIILGIEMNPERQAIIESASQDLTSYSRNIASLDIGEAIISSNFAKFAVPVSIPLFNDIAREKKIPKDFSGIKLE